jgi:hypothetical protein
MDMTRVSRFHILGRDLALNDPFLNLNEMKSGR